MYVCMLQVRERDKEHEQLASYNTQSLSTEIAMLQFVSYKILIYYRTKSVGLGCFPGFILHKHSMLGLQSGSSYNFQGNLQCST